MTEHRYRILLLAVFIAGLFLATLDFHCPVLFSRIAFLSKFLCILPEMPHKIVETFNRIGEAFIIAPLLALIVDEAAKKKLIREFSLDISAHIIGRLLPDQLREHLRSYLQMLLVRTRWDVTYTIDKWEDDKGQIVPGYVKLSTTSEYDMENRSHEHADYKFTYDVEDSFYPDIGKTRITCVQLPGDGPLEGDALQNDVKAENGYQRFPRVPKTIPLEPYNSRSKPSYKFRAESIECFRDSAYSPFFAAYPVMEATLTVLYKKADFNVTLELTFDDNSAAEKKELTDREGTEWTIRGPILPGQGFLARWDAILHSTPAPVIDSAQPSTQQPTL